MENYLGHWTSVPSFFYPRSENDICNFYNSIFWEKLSAGFQAEDPRLWFVFFLSTYELWEVTAVTKVGLTLNLTRLFILP